MLLPLDYNLLYFAIRFTFEASHVLYYDDSLYFIWKSVDYMKG